MESQIESRSALFGVEKQKKNAAASYLSITFLWISMSSTGPYVLPSSSYNDDNVDRSSRYMTLSS